jgi:nitrite reductase/ring-hydroxylating ferredoxin subunit
LSREQGDKLGAIQGYYPDEYAFTLKNGLMIVGSDFHIWPGEESTCLRAFKFLCKELKPSAVVLNGDVLDFPQISRHPPMGWEKIPSPQEEIEAAQYHLHDIEQAAPKGCRKVWTLGNHDFRFEQRLATIAREYKGIKGIHLSDHFNPCWQKAWGLRINDNIVCKHRYKGGVHAPYNNALHSGVNMITGHLHSQKVMCHSDYNGTRYGVDTGCVAEINHKAFKDYTETNPLNWISGFSVLKIRDGRLMYPELVSKWSDTHVQFRGELIKV